MKRLSGAKSLKRSILDRWSYKARSRGRKNRCYSVKFSCPACGDEAWEECKERDYDYGKIMRIFWSSECGHVDGSLRFLSDGDIPIVEESGEAVARIVPSLFLFSDHFWERYEEEDCKRYMEDWARGGRRGKLSPARFGTIWQAKEASADECRLLAVIQAEGGRDD